MAKVSLRAYNQEIETMIDRGHLDEAIAHSKHILKTFPKHLETYRLLGKAYLEYKRHPEAADIFSRVLVSAPSDFVANVGMSIIRDEENKLDDAIWHMERAFETQPSNAAIQGELQRLYGRREGVQPPRIRMTRGALSHMYVQGELYPQAISEIKSVLKEDPGRSDMQTLLARAYYRSGLKNDAAEVASTILRSNLYNFDANRVLVDILGADHPESVQAYRQRVVELDPYAAQVTGSIFTSSEVPDAAVSLEHLDWNGQPVGMRPDWETAEAISLESGQRREEQPDWLKSTFSETPPSAGQPTSVPAFDAALPSAKPAEPADEIPDFLRAAGWGAATGAFDESKSPFAESEPSAATPPIEQGDLPDWVKAMAPQQPAETPAEEEELPDWINKIGTSALPPSSEASDQFDWLSQPSQPAAQPTPPEEQPDWLKGFASQETPAAASEEQEQPDWLKGFESESAPSAAPSGELDWLTHLSETSEAKQETPSNEFDFLNQPTESLDSAASIPADASLFAEQAGTASTTPSADEFDFLNELAEEHEQLAPSGDTPSSEPSAAPLGMSTEEQDDAFAWLENLAAKQGATEGLLTKPEERLEEEPEWIKHAKDIEATQPAIPAAEQPPVTEPAANLEELGKSEQERDDAFAWLESLAAKQGASEGLLTKPEERREEEPEWVKHAKDVSAQEPPVSEPVSEQPAATDDTQAWLRSLEEEPTAEAPAREPLEELDWLKPSEEAHTEEPAANETRVWLRGLDLEETKAVSQPQEQLEETPEWMKPSESLETEEPSAEMPAAEPAATMDDTAAWLQSLDEEAAQEQPGPSAADETAIWFKSLEEAEAAPSQPVQPEEAPEELPGWMQNIEEVKAADENAPVVSEPSLEMTESTEWMQSIEEKPEPAAPETPKVETGGLPSWLRGLEEEEKTSTFAAEEELPAWLRDETGEVVAEPTRIEPTRATDWQPAETEPAESQPTISEPTISEPVASTPEPVATTPEPEPVDVVSIIEEKIAAVPAQQEEPTPPAKPRKETPVRKVTGGLTDPILGQARGELTRNNVSMALENYDRLIKKGRFLEDVIYDLREALYRYPVEVNIWQSLGDAYMRSNRLQDALDAYTKAEELLR